MVLTLILSTKAHPSSKICKIRTVSPSDTRSSSSRLGVNGRRIVSVPEKAGTGSSNGFTEISGTDGSFTAVLIVGEGGDASSRWKTGGGGLSWTSVAVDALGEATPWRAGTVEDDDGAGGLGKEKVSEGEKGRTDMGEGAPTSVL